jgi:hypothetical protein
MAITAPAAIQALRILRVRFIGDFLRVNSELLDPKLEADGVLASVLAAGSARRKLLVCPLPRGGVGDGSHVGGDLGDLPADGRRTKHQRQTAIERFDHHVVEPNPGEQTGGDNKRRERRPPGGQRSGWLQLLGHRGQHARTKLGRCAEGRHLTEPAFDVVVHCDSFAI